MAGFFEGATKAGETGGILGGALGFIVACGHYYLQGRQLSLRVMGGITVIASFFAFMGGAVGVLATGLAQI